MRQWLVAVEADAIELAERLELGDNESVRVWFLDRFPATTGRIVQNGEWDKFLSTVREIARMDPGEFERAMLQVLREYW